MVASRTCSALAGFVALVIAGCGSPMNNSGMDPDAGATPDGMASADTMVAPPDTATPPPPPPPTDGGTGSSDGGVWRSAVRGIPPYSEPICNATADLSPVASAYQNTAAGLRAAARGIAERRYPMAVDFINVQNDQQLQTWFRQRNTFQDVLGSFEVAVHEGAHIWDLTMINGQGWPYRVRDDLVIRTRRLTNFNRSEIVAMHVAASMDQYVNVYLTGQSGAQGFNTLLDEYNAYAHSIASRFCTRDGLRAGTRISARDGILTMMYYVELYLRIARTQHPQDYAAIVGDPEHLRLIRTVWARAEFWLNVSAPHPELGLRDQTIRAWTYDPNNLAEIERLP